MQKLYKLIEVWKKGQIRKLSIFLMKPGLLQVAIHFDNNCIKIKGDSKTMTIWLHFMHHEAGLV